MSVSKKMYIVTVDMGYGHQRAVHPLEDLAACPVGWSGDGMITANNYAGIPSNDRRRWQQSQKLYETISRFKNVPLFGQSMFDIMDYFQRIEPFYPRRDLSGTTVQLRQIYKLIAAGWGRHLIALLNQRPLPYLASFFVPAFFAEEHGYKGEIYCLCTDTDVSRAWAPLNPKKSRIRYLVPNKRVRERLKLYGVKGEQIFVTGFPLPQENIGGKTLRVLKHNLADRITHLDPKKKYQRKFHHTIEYYLGKQYNKNLKTHPLNITFAVGGAGAQKDIGVQILTGLHTQIRSGAVRLNLVAGVRNDVYRFYYENVTDLHLQKKHNDAVNIIYAESKSQYFKIFNKALLTTDILWTKPSELSFYAGLGLPIIMAPSVGSQEEYNRAWLHSIGAGFEQEDPRYTEQWLFDWLESGWLAEAAMAGFLHAPRNGVHHIEDIILHGKRSEIEDIHLL